MPLRFPDAMHLPSGAGRVAVVVAASMWLGALGGSVVRVSFAAGLAAIAAVMAAVFRTRAAVVILIIAIGTVSGSLAVARRDAVLEASIPQGPGVVSGVATTDALPFGQRHRFVLAPGVWQTDDGASVSWPGPAIQVVAETDDVVAGDRLICRGLLRSEPGHVRGDPVAGRFSARIVERQATADQPFIAAGNMVRARVQSRVSILGDTPGAALLSGFLIGDIADLPPDDEEALRRSGLTHFVAVSGSNVALVLGAWWLLVGPLGAGTRVRAATGLLVLMVFVVATRWESSVIRAATMAALVLGGRAVAVPLDAWTALGSAVTILLAVSGDLAFDIGFQLSVVATAGVLSGMKLWRDRRPRVFWAALAATAGAQLAVVPVLLVHFGTVPLFSPIANLLAAPLVTVATGLAGVGVAVSWNTPLVLGEHVANWILGVARIAGEWPQLGLNGVIAVGALAGLGWKTRTAPLLVAGAVVVATLGALPPGPPQLPTVTFLDVGQGDAILIRDPSGATALVDGGKDPSVLRRALRRHGVGRIDLLVASHGDADHVGGLNGIEESVDVGRFWVPAGQEVSELLGGLVANLETTGVAVDEVQVGARARLGQISIDVVGPQRRYAEENNGSVVLVIEAGDVDVLLPGDIGAVAQSELPPLRPDVLLVPHHGAGTTDLGWLADTVGPLAVISVGPNTYGHPSPEVTATLDAAGAAFRTTQAAGDISIPLSASGTVGVADITLVGR